MIAPEELKEIRERCDKATEGPWEYNETSFELDEIVDSKDKTIFDIGTYLVEDADFIANARTDIPRLLDEIDRYNTIVSTSEMAVIKPLKAELQGALDEVERYRKALKEIVDFSNYTTWEQQIATRALSEE